MEKLLPSGMYDILPEVAKEKRRLSSAILDSFEEHGFLEVSPPLLEFENSIISDNTGDLDKSMFRIMDPVSGRMMGIRPDVTMQIARIAKVRMSEYPRPLKLSYLGDVLRVTGSGLDNRRQFTQAGIEIIGCESADTDADVIKTAVSTLQRIGVKNFIVDINTPGLFDILCKNNGISQKTDLEKLADKLCGKHSISDKEALQEIVIRKDISKLDGVFKKLVELSGDAKTILPELKKLDNSNEAQLILNRIEDVVSRLDMDVSIDAAEFRGFEYHETIAFSIFSRDAKTEIARGGHYTAHTGEKSTGVTLYLDDILSLI